MYRIFYGTSLGRSLVNRHLAAHGTAGLFLLVVRIHHIALSHLTLAMEMHSQC